MKFQPRLFLALCIAFLFAGIAGVLLHEGGHALAAKALGYEYIQIHYQRTSASGSPTGYKLIACHEEYHRNPPADTTFNPCETLTKTYNSERAWVRIGGPLANMLLGTIGFLALAFSQKSIRSKGRLSYADWAMVLLSFFWSRQLFNVIPGSGRTLGSGGMTGDERFLEQHYHLPAGILQYGTAILAAVILSVVVFRFIPFAQRLTFLAAGLVGSILCVLLWFGWLGPVVLP